MDTIDTTVTLIDVDITSAEDVGSNVNDNSMIDDVYNELPTGMDNSHLASIIISLDINNA